MPIPSCFTDLSSLQDTVRIGAQAILRPGPTLDETATGAEPPSLGIVEFLRSDPLVRLTLGLVAAATLLLAVRPDLLHWTLAMRAITTIFLGLVVVALWPPRHHPESKPEQRFWRILLLAYGSWIVTNSILLAGAGQPLKPLAGIGVEVSVALYYVLLIFAVESSAHKQRFAKSIEGLSLLSIVLFILGLIVYFDFIPALAPSELAHLEPSSEWLFGVIDLLVTLRLAYLHRVVQDPRWRTLYGFLASAIACSLVGDMLGLLYSRAEANVFYAMTMILVILTARLRYHRFPKPSSDGTLLSMGDPGESNWQPIVYALIFPVVHFLLYRLDFLEVGHRPLREMVVLLWILVLGAMAVIQNRRMSALRRRLEVERQDMVDEVQARSAELERFAYTVSHDLKSPLVTISGFVGLLEKDMDRGDTKRAASAIQRIQGATQHMGRFLDELLNMSRAGQALGEMERVSLEEVATEVVEVISGRLSERGVEVELDPALPTVWADRNRLLQALQNLMENAVKFMGDQPAPRIEVSQRREGRQTVCFVRDNGVGIDPEHQSRVFDLFGRLGDRAEGSGIGLATVKRIIDSLGGRIWIESEGRGHGASFCFTLPEDEA